MHGLGIPQDRIAKRLGLARTSFQYHLPKMAALPNSAKADLSRGFTVAQVAQKHGWLDTRPEIEPFTWNVSSDQQFSWPVSAPGC
jgi:hypothetical protein